MLGASSQTPVYGDVFKNLNIQCFGFCQSVFPAAIAVPYLGWVSSAMFLSLCSLLVGIGGGRIYLGPEVQPLNDNCIGARLVFVLGSW